MKSVRIESNQDGTYSAWIFDICYLNKGSYSECQRVLENQGEST